jgi:hypothetical protein
LRAFGTCRAGDSGVQRELCHRHCIHRLARRQRLSVDRHFDPALLAGELPGEIQIDHE